MGKNHSAGVNEKNDFYKIRQQHMQLNTMEMSEA